MLKEIAFTKLHGCGNCFIVIVHPRDDNDNLVNRAKLSEWAQRWCAPHFGIGADGLLVVENSKNSTNNTFHVSMFNPDGSNMGMCGNGIRCVARFLVTEQLVTSVKTSINFSVDGKAISVVLNKPDGSVSTVDMGEPIFTPAEIPLVEPIPETLEVNNLSLPFVALSMGNPHCVIFYPENDTPTSMRDAAQTLGPLIEHHNAFPKRTNTEFVSVNQDGSLTAEVWERGAGPTLACGTGACATLVAAVLAGKSARKNTVHLPGGMLSVSWDEESNHVFLSGPAEAVFSGKILA